MKKKIQTKLIDLHFILYMKILVITQILHSLQLESWISELRKKIEIFNENVYLLWCV